MNDDGRHAEKRTRETHRFQSSHHHIWILEYVTSLAINVAVCCKIGGFKKHRMLDVVKILIENLLNLKIFRCVAVLVFGPS